MAPIRVGFIGLNSAGQSWGVWAHLPYLKDTSKYTIAALCNSSVESAKAAIKGLGLPESTKAYGSAQDLANDPNIDLVVVSVRVDKHYDAIVPALQAGKNVFCEWPLAKDAAEAQKLESLAKSKGVKTMVGLQALQSPAVLKVKEIVDSGKIGKVLSTTFHGTPTFFGAKELEFLGYSHDKNVGGNMLTIYAIHSLESIQYALGDLVSFNSIIENKRPEVQLIDFTGKYVKTIPSTSHDQILIQGHLDSGALISYHMRGGPAFAGKEGTFWRIHGEKGEIQVTGENSYLQIADDNVVIQLHDHETGETTQIKPEKHSLSELPLYSRNIGRIYEAYADGKEAGYKDWSHAVLRHKLVEEIYEREAKGAQDTPASYRKA